MVEKFMLPLVMLTQYKITYEYLKKLKTDVLLEYSIL